MKMQSTTKLNSLAIVCAITVLATAGCGGGGSSAAAPTAPTTAATTTTTTTATTAAASVTENIVGITGSAAFSPNPVQASAGSTIVWKNTSNAAHHLVMDNGTVIGDLAVGATLTTQVPGTGGNFHCTIHPTMVGSINGATAPPDPMPNSSGGYDY